MFQIVHDALFPGSQDFWKRNRPKASQILNAHWKKQGTFSTYLFLFLFHISPALWSKVLGEEVFNLNFIWKKCIVPFKSSRKPCCCSNLLLFTDWPGWNLFKETELSGRNPRKEDEEDVDKNGWESCSENNIQCLILPLLVIIGNTANSAISSHYLTVSKFSSNIQTCLIDFNWSWVGFVTSPLTQTDICAN